MTLSPAALHQLLAAYNIWRDAAALRREIDLQGDLGWLYEHDDWQQPTGSPIFVDLHHDQNGGAPHLLIVPQHPQSALPPWRVALTVNRDLHDGRPQYPVLTAEDVIEARFHGDGDAFDRFLGLPAGTTPSAHQNIVFLDFDGVMISSRALFLTKNQAAKQAQRDHDAAHWQSRPDRRPRPPSTFDPCAAAMLVRLCQLTGARLVVSSAWCTLGPEVVLDVLAKNSVPLDLLHPDWRVIANSMDDRASAIERWLIRHPDVTRYAALDDDPSITRLSGAVPCDPAEGFTMAAFFRACELLGVDRRLVTLSGPPLTWSAIKAAEDAEDEAVRQLFGSRLLDDDEKASEGVIARSPVSVAGGEVRVLRGKDGSLRVEGDDPDMPRTRQAQREYLQDRLWAYRLALKDTERVLALLDEVPVDALPEDEALPLGLPEGH